MTDPGTVLWFFAIVGGTIILGIAVAYGVLRNKKRTIAEKRASERGAHEIYEKEDRQLDAQ
jgi:hypothetical protein